MNTKRPTIKQLRNKASKADLARFDTIKNSDIDYSDIPELDDRLFEIERQLAASEASGFSKRTPQQIRDEAKQKLNPKKKR